MGNKYTIEQLRSAWGAGRHVAEKAGEVHPLEGKFFLQFDEKGDMHWQGRVLRPMENGTFLVQLFSWLDGRPNKQVIVKLDKMVGWSFYTSMDEWRDEADNRLKQQGREPADGAADELARHGE